MVRRQTMKRVASQPLRGAETARTGEERDRACPRVTELHDRYQRQGLLGMGGIGQVEHAFDLKLQRDVAIKTLHPRSSRKRGRTNADRLRHEARISCQLEHPNILPIYELLEDADGKETALVMRFVEGETLLDCFQQLGPACHNQTVLEPILEALVQVCDALVYAHAQRVLHLDLKPENVMIDSSGHVFVLDWGEAVQSTLDSDGNLRPLKQDQHAAGTRRNMAPEQFDRDTQRTDQRTDVYALGGILYHAICGRAPFQDMDAEREGDTPTLVVPPIALTVRTPLLTRLSQVAMRALAYDRTERHPHVHAFREEIKTIAREESFLLPLHVAPGTYLVREGEKAESAYIILEGECSVRRRAFASDVSVATLHAGETFGESALLEQGGYRSASVVATTQVTLLAFDHAAIRKAVGGGWVSAFMRSLVMRSNRSDPLPAAQLRCKAVE
jgi:eukaryotic-like serine/threonine-protein kinase